MEKWQNKKRCRSGGICSPPSCSSSLPWGGSRLGFLTTSPQAKRLRSACQVEWWLLAKYTLKKKQSENLSNPLNNEKLEFSPNGTICDMSSKKIHQVFSWLSRHPGRWLWGGQDMDFPMFRPFDSTPEGSFKPLPEEHSKLLVSHILQPAGA